MRKEAGAEASLEPRMLLVSLEETEFFRFDEAVSEIYQDYPLLGYIFSSLKRKRCWDIPTAGISPTNVLYYNPRFMASLNSSQRRFVLLHECLHKINQHFIRGDEIMKAQYDMTGAEYMKWRKKKEGKSVKIKKAVKHINKMRRIENLLDRMNVCEDIAINQSCELKFERPPIGVFLAEVNKKYELSMEANREWEYYFEELEKVKDFKGDGDLNHDIQLMYDGEMSENEAKEMAQIFKNILGDAIKIQKNHDAERQSSGKDLLPILDVIPDLTTKIKDRHVWKSLVQNNFGDHRINQQVATLKRPDRRNDENPWGRKRRTVSKHTIVIIDTSMSCLNIIPQFLGVVSNAMKRNKTSVDLLLTTTQPYQILENVKHIDMNEINVKSGGTDLTTAQDWITANKPNGGRGLNVIVITDGHTPWKTDVAYSVSAIYTEKHKQLPNVTNYAILYEEE